MPKAITERTTIDLHAYWYNVQRADDADSDTLYRTLCLCKKVDGDGQPTDEEEWIVEESNKRYLEHVTLYDAGLHEDVLWINEQLMRSMRINGKSSSMPSAKEMARTRTLLYTRRVTEMTDEQGIRQLLTEAVFKRLPERETAFIDNAIARLDESPVPVYAEERDKARSEKAKQQSMIERGFPIHEQDLIGDEEAYARDLAEDRFPAHAQGRPVWER